MYSTTEAENYHYQMHRFYVATAKYSNWPHKQWVINLLSFETTKKVEDQNKQMTDLDWIRFIFIYRCENYTKLGHHSENSHHERVESYKSWIGRLINFPQVKPRQAIFIRYTNEEKGKKNIRYL